MDTDETQMGKGISPVFIRVSAGFHPWPRKNRQKPSKPALNPNPTS
jgi:hypothetical protein